MPSSQNSSTTQQVVNTARLDTTKIPPLVGRNAKLRLNELWRILTQTTIPIYCVGDSGTGKTITMKNLAKAYSDRFNVPAYYVQLSAEDTKTSVIIGLRLQNGTLMPIDGVLAIAAQENAIVIFDEITHSTSNMLLMFNSIDGGESVITIGDRRIDASGVKIVYGSNRSSHVGNIRIPQSFANRVITYPFGYMEPAEEAEIAKDTAARKYTNGSLTIPDSFYTYLANYVNDLRTPEWPLSARNIAHAAVMTQLELNRVKAPVKTDPYFVQGANIESVRRTIAERILGKVNSTTDMQSQPIVDFITTVSAIGKDKFVEIVKMSMSYYCDLDGAEIIGEQHRTKIGSSII